MNTEIAEYHVKVLQRMYATARENYDIIGKTWHNYENKQYGVPWFKKVEILYQEVRGMAGDMFDLSNLAERLGDFVGRWNPQSMTRDTKVTNVFHAPVGAVQQNFDESKGTQIVGSTPLYDGIEELKGLLEDVKDLLAELPQDTTVDVGEAISDLQECMNQDQPPKRSMLIAFGDAVIKKLKQLLTVKGIADLDTVTTQIPQIIANLEPMIHHIYSLL